MKTKESRKLVAQQTLGILEKKEYQIQGKKIAIDIEDSILYTPNEAELVWNNLKKEKEHRTRIEVTNETTLSAGKRLVEKGKKVIVLNFASAKNPGGGFINGSIAQEESLAYASTLYETLKKHETFYHYHLHQNRSALYSDHMIYSPNVTVFRSDGGALLENPYPLSMITSPAVNKGAVEENEKHHIEKIDETMKKRIQKILAVALSHQYEVIVLGAFGCGVFKNDPKKVAHYFAEILKEEKFKNQFEQVVFAVYDETPNKANYYAFKRTFS